jgi:hypothetical protein
VKMDYSEIALDKAVQNRTEVSWTTKKGHRHCGVIVLKGRQRMPIDQPLKKLTEVLDFPPGLTDQKERIMWLSANCCTWTGVSIAAYKNHSRIVVKEDVSLGPSPLPHPVTFKLHAPLPHHLRYNVDGVEVDAGAYVMGHNTTALPEQEELNYSGRASAEMSKEVEAEPKTERGAYLPGPAPFDIHHHYHFYLDSLPEIKLVITLAGGVNHSGEITLANDGKVTLDLNKNFSVDPSQKTIR